MQQHAATRVGGTHHVFCLFLIPCDVIFFFHTFLFDCLHARVELLMADEHIYRVTDNEHLDIHIRPRTHTSLIKQRVVFVSARYNNFEVVDMDAFRTDAFWTLFSEFDRQGAFFCGYEHGTPADCHDGRLVVGSNGYSMTPPRVLGEARTVFLLFVCCPMCGSSCASVECMFSFSFFSRTVPHTFVRFFATCIKAALPNMMLNTVHYRHARRLNAI